MRRNGMADGGEAANRQEFFASLGFDESSVVRGEQVHGDTISLADSAITFSGTDGLLTRQRNLLLTISVADCVPVLIFDSRQKIAAAVHSGWKGTTKNIVGKTADFLLHELNSQPEDVVAFIGPSAGECCYEVGEDVARKFDDAYKSGTSKQGKYKLDQMGQNFRVCLALETVSQQRKFSLQRRVIFDNPVVYDREVPGTIGVGMRIDRVRLPVRRPPRVSYANSGRLNATGHGFKPGHFAGSLNHVDVTVGKKSYARRIIPAVLEPLQPLHEDFTGVPVSDITNYPAHESNLLLDGDGG